MKQHSLKAVLAALLIAAPVIQAAGPETAQAATRLAAPTNVLLTSSRTLTWTAVPNASSYLVQVYDSVTGKLLGERRPDGAATSQALYDVIAQNGTYYVRITAVGTGSYASSTSVRSNELTLNNSITLFAPATPTLGTDGVATWKATTNFGYTLNVYHSPSNTLVTSKTLEKDATTYDVKGLIPANGAYYIKLIARGNGNDIRDSAESTPSTIRTLKTALIAFPANIALDRDRKATWTNVTGNTGYRVSVYRADNNAIVGFAQADKNATSLDLTTLIKTSGKYYVRVQTIGDGGNSLDSAPSPVAQYFLEPHLYVVPDAAMTSTTDSSTGLQTTRVLINRQTALDDLDGDTTLTRLLAPLSVNSGGLKLLVPGSVIKKLADRSSDADVRFLSGIGNWTMQANQIEDLATAAGIDLSKHTLQIGIEPAAANAELGLVGAPVKFSLQWLNDDGETVADTTTASSYLSVTVAMKGLNLDNGVDNLAGVRLESGTNKLLSVPAVFTTNTDGLLATFKYQGTGTFGVVKRDVGFPDVSSSYYARDSIASLTTRGVINGFEDGTFRPNDTVTRAQFASMLSKALGLNETSKAPAATPNTAATETTTTPSPTTSNNPGAVVPAVPSGSNGSGSTMPASDNVVFSDVEADSWYADVVKAAYKAKLISGRGEGIFAPNDLITHQEMATMITRALKSAEFSTAVDSSEQSGLLAQVGSQTGLSDYAADPVALCVREQILAETTLHGFSATAKADRGMAADMLYRMLLTLNFIN
jgi:hypothetical protein